MKLLGKLRKLVDSQLIDSVNNNPLIFSLMSSCANILVTKFQFQLLLNAKSMKMTIKWELIDAMQTTSAKVTEHAQIPIGAKVTVLVEMDLLRSH
jgi:hypothetical protein